ncbi:MAG: hypothetical protein WC822_05960, partial [Candidatus Paceibacterota bacterium]
MQIGLDIDNVLYPFTSVFTHFVEVEEGLAPGTLSDEALTWEWYKHQWGWTTKKFLEVYERGIRNEFLFTTGHPMTGSLWAVNELVRAGHDVTYITNRKAGDVPLTMIHDQTRAWLHHQGFPMFHRVMVSENKNVVPTDVFLDDSPHNIEALVDAGHPCPVVWDRPHNQDVGGLRAYTWAQFLELVEWKSELQK